MTHTKRMLPILALPVLATALVFGLPGSLHAQIALYGGTTKEHTVQPGEEVEGSIRVRNQGSQPRDLRLYGTDYSFTAAGDNDYAPPGTLERSNAEWIVVRPRRTTVAAGEEVAISYRIRVPEAGETTEPTGTYWSMVMLEVQGDLAADGPGPDEGMDVGTRMRYGVQMVTHFGDSGTRQLAFSGQSVDVEEGTRRFVLTVENTGTRAVRPDMGLELYGGGGDRVRSDQEQRGLLYPGTSLRQSFDMGPLPAGRYEAMILADPGEGDIFAGQYHFDVSR